MIYENETYEVKYDLVMDVTAYHVTYTRVEECHGYHTFYDTKTDYQINSITIKIGDSVIDLTDRLTAEEKHLLTDNQDL